ncbi:MAG: ADP-heptose:LPS heptosyltransferase [Bacteriovoracaceae bacterium]|jgi:ADP-heptose:LPS heptosyltransferase
MIRKFIKTFSLLKTILLRKKVDGTGVALVKLDAIGDFFILLSVLKLIDKNELEEKKLTIFCSHILVTLGENFYPVIDWVGVDLKKFEASGFYRAKLLSNFKNKSFSTVINLVYSRDWKSDFLVSSLTSSHKLCFFGDLAKQGRLGRWLGAKAYDQRLTGKCLTEFDSLKAILGEVLNIDYSKWSVERVTKGSYIVIFPGASWFGKAWPAENFKKVIGKILIDTNLDIKICGGPSDKHLEVHFKDLLNNRVEVLIGNTSLLQLSDLINKARSILTNDTSAAHMAQYFGTKGVALIGGGHFGRFLPYSNASNRVDSVKVINKKMPCYGCNWNCHFEHGSGAVPCISEISWEEAYSELKVFL